MRLDVAGNVQVVSADPDDDVIADDDRGRGRVVVLIEIADLLPPALLPSLHLERHQVAIRCDDIQRVAENAYAAVADVVAALALPLEVPDLAPRPRVDRPDVIRHRD